MIFMTLILWYLCWKKRHEKLGFEIAWGLRKRIVSTKEAINANEDITARNNSPPACSVFDLYTLCWSFGILEPSFWFMKGNNLHMCVNAIWVNVNYWRECLSYYVRKKYTIAETEKDLGKSCRECVLFNLFFIIFSIWHCFVCKWILEIVAWDFGRLLLHV